MIKASDLPMPVAEPYFHRGAQLDKHRHVEKVIAETSISVVEIVRVITNKRLRFRGEKTLSE